jgi:hypothetical protein
VRRDQMFTKQPLCHLSYAGIRSKVSASPFSGKDGVELGRPELPLQKDLSCTHQARHAWVVASRPPCIARHLIAPGAPTSCSTLDGVRTSVFGAWPASPKEVRRPE